VDGSKVNDGNIEERPKFYTEKNLAGKPRAKYADYTGSGYDRGHLAPDATFDYDEDVVNKTYTMANIVAMAPGVNRKTWSKAEKYERRVASKMGEIYVLNGVIYPKTPQRLGDNGVAVPSRFWKMVYNKDGSVKECFMYDNDLNVDCSGDEFESHKVNCDSLLK